MSARGRVLVALALVACGRTGLETEPPVLVRAGAPHAVGIGGGGATGGAPVGGGGAGAGGASGGAPQGGAAGHGGSITVGGSGGNPIATCAPDQAPCSDAAACCSKMCHTEDIPVCGPPPCAPVGASCTVAAECCSTSCADGLCASPICPPGASTCTSCEAASCCSELTACGTSAMCAEDAACAAKCVDGGKPIASCWQACVSPSLLANALFACITKLCAAACP